MPKCLLIADNLSHTGGISSVIFAQIKGMHALGWEIYLFGMYGPVSAELTPYLTDFVVVENSKYKKNRLNQVWNSNADKLLDIFLAKLDCTQVIAHIHSLSLGLSPSIYKALSNNNVKFVITAHDSGWACPTGYQYNFKAKEFCKLTPLSLGCLFSNCDKREYVNKAFKVVKIVALDYISRIKKNVCKVYAPSNWLIEHISPRFPQNTPIELLENPVSVLKTEFSYSNREYFLFVGRLWEEKGIDRFLDIAAKKYPVKVIGDGGLRDELQKKYSSAVFLGKLPPDQVLNELKTARALVLPSIYLESFGLVVAEALANGVPVIVSKTVGAASLVQEGINGFIVDMNVERTVLNACEILMNNEKCYQLSENAYQIYWSRPLTEEKYAAQLDADFKSLLSSN